jgi:hypothetical protein
MSAPALRALRASPTASSSLYYGLGAPSGVVRRNLAGDWQRLSARIEEQP